MSQYDYGYTYDSRRRSVYVPRFRSNRMELFDVFDGADPNTDFQWTLSSLDHWAAAGVAVNPSPASSPATFAAGEDVKLIELAKQTTRRLRLLVSNEGDQPAANVELALQVAEKLYQDLLSGGRTTRM